MDKNQAQKKDREPPGKQQLREIYGCAAKGQFHRVVHLLEQTNFSKESTLNVFISVSATCSKKLETCELDALEKLTKKLVRGLNNLTEDETVSYVLSLFHIFKALCSKERYDDLSKMQEVICPTFINTFKEIKKAKEYYDMIKQQVCYSMRQLVNAKESKHNQHLLVLIRMLFEACNIIWNNPENSYSFVCKCYAQFVGLKPTCDQTFKFYTNILEELAESFDRTTEHTEEVLIRFLPLFFEICQYPNKNVDLDIVELDKLLFFVETNFKHEQYFYCHSMIKVVTALIPTKIEELPKNVINIEKTLNSFKATHTKLFYNVIGFLNTPLSKVFEYYMITDEQKFIKLSDDVILNLVKFSFEKIISPSLMSFKEYHCGCNTKRNNNAFLTSLMLLELLQPWIKYVKTLSKKLLTQLIKCFEFLYDFLEEIKKHDCKNWFRWSSELTRKAYEISVILESAKNESREAIIKCFLKNSLAVERPESGDTKIRNDIVRIHSFGIRSLNKLQFERENWLESMGLTALHCLLFTQERNTTFHNHWLLLKIKMKKDTNLQQQTLVKVLFKQSKQLSEFINIEALLTKSKQIELLTFELSRYRAVWKSRIPMMAAFENLCKIADPLTIADVTLQIYSAGDVKMSESTLIFNARAVLEKNKSRDATLALAVMKFYQYKNIREELTNRTIEQMKTKEVKRSVTPGPIPKDKDDECDIVSVYSHLRLVEYVKVLNLLDSCLVSVQNFIDDSLGPQVLKNLIKLLANIGLEYKLHNFPIKSIQAFEISMKFARTLKASEDQLFALSNIIEMANEKSPMVKDLIIEGDALVRQLESNYCDKSHKNSLNEIITLFYICKSKALVYDNPRQSNEAWKKADALCESTGHKGHLRAELYVISYKLTSNNNCNFLEHDPIREPGTYKLHAAHEILADLMCNNVINNSETCTLFNIVEELTKVYRQMRQPRELRSYSRNCVTLAQKLNLPLRCVDLLLLLAEADITTNELNDAEVKLNGIEDIFSICNSDLVLEVPQHHRQYSPSSPTQAVKSFTLPKFLYHKQACLCFMCLNWQFQKLYLAKSNLNTLINIYRNEKQIVEDYVNGAIRLYQIFHKNIDKFINKASMVISDGLVPDFIETFVDTLGFGLYEYVFYLLRNNDITKAKKVNEILVAFLEPVKHKYAHLYRDVVLQTLTYLIAEINLPIPGIVTDSTENDQKLKPPKQLFVAGTPISKKLQVVVSVNEREIFSPLKEKPKTKVNLFASEEAIDEESDQELPPTNNGDDHQFSKPKETAWGIFATPATPLLGPVKSLPFSEEFSGQTPCSHKRATSEKLNPKPPGAIPKFKMFTFDTPKLKNLGKKIDSTPSAPLVGKRIRKMLTSDDLGVKRLEDDFSEILLTDDIPKSVKQSINRDLGTPISAQSQTSVRKRNIKMSTSDDLGVKTLEDDFDKLLLTDDNLKKYDSKQSSNRDAETATGAQSRSSVKKRSIKMSTSDDLGVKRLEDDFNNLLLSDDILKKYESKQSINKDAEPTTGAQSRSSVRKRNTKIPTSDDLGVKKLEDDFNETPLIDGVPKSLKKYGSKQSTDKDLEAATSAHAQRSVRKRNTKMSSFDDLGVKKLEDKLIDLPLDGTAPNTASQRSVRQRNTKMSTSDDRGLRDDLNQATLFEVPKSVRKYGSKHNSNKDLDGIAESQLAPVIKRIIKKEKHEMETPKENLEGNSPGSSNTNQTVKSRRAYKPRETPKKLTTDLSDASVRHQPESVSKNTRKRLLSRKINEKLNAETPFKEKNNTTTVDEKVENPTPMITPCKIRL
ncbi:unnamed protein product [Ceutorhynchus assimilis]|uniref:Uncharacterized protein n=1 Tax=Ceutorhynchus assimilis TaxID=467358 RepID=A0A9N9MU84_9CUCU|nr:unnamed protein product [Ceutorhynchus assimilis]